MMASTSRHIGKELIAEALTLTGTANEPCDIHDLDLGGHGAVGFHQFGQLVNTIIRDIHQSHVWFDGAKAVIAGLRFRAAAYCIEQG